MNTTRPVEGRRLSAGLAGLFVGMLLLAGVPTLAWVVSVAASQAGAEQTGPGVKVLPESADATQETVLLGRRVAGDMIIQLELEPAKAMWMATTASVQMVMDQSKGTWVLLAMPPYWSDHPVNEDDLYHVDVKPIDPQSNTRIPYASVKFEAINKDNGRRVEGPLHPMWGGSGLHYALNSGLAGDGVYEATVTVGVPTFARDPKEKDRWMEPATATFHFKLAGGKLTEVSEPMVAAAP